MGIREALAQRRSRKDETRRQRAADDATIQRIAEYISSVSLIHAMAEQGFVPELPAGLTAADLIPSGKLHPNSVVDHCIELADGRRILVTLALQRARELDLAPAGDPRTWSKAEYDQMRFFAGVHTALYGRGSPPGGKG